MMMPKKAEKAYKKAEKALERGQQLLGKPKPSLCMRIKKDK